MHVADGQYAFKHIWFFLRIRLVHHAHITLARGPGLVGVYPWYDDEPVLCLFLDLNKTAGVITYSLFVVSRTGADNHNKLLAFPGKYFFDFLVPSAFDFCQFRGQRKLFPYFCR